MMDWANVTKIHTPPHLSNAISPLTNMRCTKKISRRMENNRKSLLT